MIRIIFLWPLKSRKDFLRLTTAMSYLKKIPRIYLRMPDNENKNRKIAPSDNLPVFYAFVCEEETAGGIGIWLCLKVVYPVKIGIGIAASPVRRGVHSHVNAGKSSIDGGT